MTESVERRSAGVDETRKAQRTWWDDEAAGYYREHGSFLGDVQLVWGPEGWTEADLGLLTISAGQRVLEIGAGAGQGGRWLRETTGVDVVSSDLSGGMLEVARSINARTDTSLPLVQCDGLALPFAEESFDVVLTAYGVVPFVADSAHLMREVARVLKPGGQFVFSTTHPIRWAFPDDPSERGLKATQSYFDTTPYVEAGSDGEATYVEHHRTLGERVREISAAGLILEDLVEPTWRPGNAETWGGWSPLRGAVIPGTAIFCTRRP